MKANNDDDNTKTVKSFSSQWSESFHSGLHEKRHAGLSSSLRFTHGRECTRCMKKPLHVSLWLEKYPPSWPTMEWTWFYAPRHGEPLSWCRERWRGWRRQWPWWIWDYRPFGLSDATACVMIWTHSWSWRMFAACLPGKADHCWSGKTRLTCKKVNNIRDSWRTPEATNDKRSEVEQSVEDATFCHLCSWRSTQQSWHPSQVVVIRAEDDQWAMWHPAAIWGNYG